MGDNLMETSVASASRGGASAAAPAGAARGLLQKRAKKFFGCMPAVLADNPDAVHDARVASRRLQQAVSVLFSKPRPARVRRIRRTARRVRHALGDWGDCDVLLDLVARRRRRARGTAAREAWELVHRYLLGRREKEAARARKKLLRKDPLDDADLARRLVEDLPADGEEALGLRVRGSVHDARAGWQSALAQAEDTQAVTDLHALRIATKHLRYRAELLHDLGLPGMKRELAWLAALQDALGDWHDHQLLLRAMAETIGRPDAVLDELPRIRTLLAALDTERKRTAKSVERIFRMAGSRPTPDEVNA